MTCGNCGRRDFTVRHGLCHLCRAIAEDEPWADWSQVAADCTCQWDTPIRQGLYSAGGNGLNGTWRRRGRDPHCPARHPHWRQP